METTLGLVDDAASAAQGSDRRQAAAIALSEGYFFEPTVLTDLRPTPSIMTEEPFAPVMPLLDFSNLDDVIAAANNTQYGLAAYVFTNDLTIAWKMAEGLEAGIIGINDPVPATPQCPFGGMKESGLGRELGPRGARSLPGNEICLIQIAGLISIDLMNVLPRHEKKSPSCGGTFPTCRHNS